MMDIDIKRIIPDIEKGGEFALTIVTILLALDSFTVIDLSITKYLRGGLWTYLLLNVAVVNVFKFFKNRNNVTCPKCSKKLNVVEEYECPKHGRLLFKRKK